MPTRTDVLSREVMAAVRRASYDNLAGFYHRHAAALAMSRVTFYRLMNGDRVAAARVRTVADLAAALGLLGDDRRVDVGYLAGLLDHFDRLAEAPAGDQDEYQVRREMLFLYYNRHRERLRAAVARLGGA